MNLPSDLKSGDFVILQHYGLAESREVVPIARVTKTMIVLSWEREQGSHEMRFNRETGRKIGVGGFWVPRIIAATPELIAEVRAENRRNVLVRKLKNVSWESLSMESLEAMWTIASRSAAKTTENQPAVGRG